jgi:hypothetical protein
LVADWLSPIGIVRMCARAHRVRFPDHRRFMSTGAEYQNFRRGSLLSRAGPDSTQ